MATKEFWLPPKGGSQTIEEAEQQWATEDILQAVRSVFAGKLVNGAVIGGSDTGADGMPVQSAGLQSGNWSPGSSGWRIEDTGAAEFQSGTFRGTILGKSPTAKHGRNGDALDLVSGTRNISYGRFDSSSGTEQLIVYQDPAFIVKRAGMWLFTAGIEGNLDASGGIVLAIRGAAAGTVVSTTAGVRHVGTSFAGTGGFILSCSALIKQNANDLAWVTMQNTSQADIFNVSGSFFSCAYISDI